MSAVTTVAACAIERDFFYVAQSIDDLEPQADRTRMSFYDAQNAAAPWMAHDLPWRTVAVCVWRDSPFGNRVYVALSREGEIELLGPSKQPQLIEHLPGAGFNKPWSAKLGSAKQIRQIGRGLYACGPGYAVYCRKHDGWRQIGEGGDELRRTNPIAWFDDVNGHNENDIYAVGPTSATTSRIAHYDGEKWRSIQDDLPKTIQSICLSRMGGVFLGGASGYLAYVAPTETVKSLSISADVSVYRMTEYRDRLFFTSNSGLYVLNTPDALAEKVVTGLKPDIQDAAFLDTADDVLWVFGYKDAAFFDGDTWTRVHDPDNPWVGQ